MKQIINNELEIEVPQNFKVLSIEESKEWLGHFAKDCVALRNIDEHVAIIISYKKTNLLNRNMSLAKVLASSKSTLKTLKPSIKFIKDINTTIDGKEALGFEYSEEIKGINQNVEYLLVKHLNTHYSINYLGRIETYQKNYSSFTDLLRTVKFID